MAPSSLENQQQPPEPIDPDEEACKHAIQLVFSSIFPMTLYAAIELGLLELVAAAGSRNMLTADELAAIIEATNPAAPAMIERILRLLACHSVLTFQDSIDATGRLVRRYGAAPVCKYLTLNEEGSSLASLLLLTHDKITIQSWYHVKDAVLNGGVPFNKAHGGLTEFEYHVIDQQFGMLFQEGMKGHAIVFKKLLEKYEGLAGASGVVVDVGGGTGVALKLIRDAHPHIKGINYDLPHVIARAPALSGVEHIGGDMFESVPVADTIFMKMILHDWCDEDCLKILKNCRKALPETGKVVSVEPILPESPEASTEAHCVFPVDVLMLLESPSGKERTKKEFESLAIESGFTGFRAVCSFATVWVMEFTK